MQMAKELTVFKSKDIDNIDVHAKGCVNNALHFKEVPSRHVLACCCIDRIAADMEPRDE